jgi:hypothetical protein
MKYEAIREEIKSGDLLAWSHRSWRSWYDIKIQLVRFFTQSEYCHVGVSWVVGGRVLVIEAVMPKVRIYPLSSLGNFYWIPEFMRWDSEVESKALNYVGTDYSQTEALAAFFEHSIHRDKMQCAKLVATLAGLERTNRTPSEMVDYALSKDRVLHKVESL